MVSETIVITGRQEKPLLSRLSGVLPEAGNLALCLTCGMCSSGCPVTGIEQMDPRKMLRMIAMGLDEQVLASDWPWVCTLCRQCILACPMRIDIPQIVINIREMRPKEAWPKDFKENETTKTREMT